jgi:hypothetical protein
MVVEKVLWDLIRGIEGRDNIWSMVGGFGLTIMQPH